MGNLKDDVLNMGMVVQQQWQDPRMMFPDIGLMTHKLRLIYIYTLSAFFIHPL